MNYSNNSSTIRLHFLTKAGFLRNRTLLKEFISDLFGKEGVRKVHCINYIFCSDPYLLRLNKTYLKHNAYTDIVTFELSEKKEPLIADIFISVERVRENATKFSTSLSTELIRVAIHGALHLCGYKDKTAKDSAGMRARESYYLKLFRSTCNNKKD